MGSKMTEISWGIRFSWSRGSKNGENMDFFEKSEKNDRKFSNFVDFPGIRNECWVLY